MNGWMRSRATRGESGALSVEMVVLTPVLVACILAIAGGARYVEARDQVSSAAMIAARAASLEAGPGTAGEAGRLAAVRALAERGRSCPRLDVRVDNEAFVAGGSVSATVTCIADLSDLVGFGLPGSRSFSATAVVPIDSHRVVP